ncbi:Putative PEX22-like peroxisomal biogenesis factor 22-like [Podospora comata]|uniref:PEX22-like peroxisomal biogenesis factor 22-like n=1 Tax=Podospora comata TaxID=48703 RepID=A0ABY6SFN1_PODCO|nr:Putative PEX22-like peroxisomal biogenesis factor 22-like [Podospora comata]
MSPPYESSRRRGVWNHWVPLAVTVTVATVGVVAWVWSQRKEEDQEEAETGSAYQDLDYDEGEYGDNPAYGASRDGAAGGTQTRSGGPGVAAAASQVESSTLGWAALRRTPSPSQFFDTARRTVTGGLSAAGAAVGSALAAIREEDKTAYADHETWSEEIEAKKERVVPSTSQAKDTNKRRKKVAIVISADNHIDDVDADGYHEHASILSHIPRSIDTSKHKLYVLIYAPNLKETTRESPSNRPPPSLSSSFSNIDPAQAQTPGDEAKSPAIGPSTSDPAYNAIYAQAQAFVEKDSMILTFTTLNGHSHILRHIQPEIIYLQESLGGENGSIVTNLQTWLRHDIILVVGAESGHGGLADSESEAEKPGKAEEIWWHREDRVGRGRGVIVVDAQKVQDDWARRVLGKE